MLKYSKKIRKESLMKKTFLLSLVATTLLSAANDKPMSLGLAMAYMNNIVELPSRQYNQIRSDNAHVKANLDALYSPTYAISNLSVTYVYNNVVGVHGSVPILSNDITDKSGLGDAMLEATVNLNYFIDEEGVYSSIVGVRYTFDTGEVQDGLGMGSSAFSIFWDTGGELGKGFDGYVSLMWTYYSDRVDGLAIGDEDTGWIGFKHRCLLNDKIDTNLKLNWQTKFSTSQTDGYNIVDATLQWESDKFLKHVPIKVGMKLPVWDSSEVKNEFSVFAGVGGTF